MPQNLDAIALGSIYVDTNLSNYPIPERGKEMVGKEYKEEPGGSAVNICKALRTLGRRVGFIGIVGTDVRGSSMEELLRNEGIEPFLIKEGGLITNISFNMTDVEGIDTQCTAGTANAALSPERVLPKLEEVIGGARFLFLGGCFKLKSFVSDFETVAELAHARGANVVVDHNRIPAETSYDMRAAVKELVLVADYYFPGHDEFCELWGVEDIEQGLQLLHERAPRLRVVAKDAANGAFYWENGVHHVPAEKIEVKEIVNAAGAGDNFNGGVMAALVEGRSIAEAVSYGCKVAAAKMKDHELPQLV